MPRLVRHEPAAPIKIDPNAPAGEPNAWPRDEQGNLKILSICACGLSARFPFCDGAHKICRNEEPGHIYTYDPVTRDVIEKKPMDTPGAPPATP